MTNTRKNAYIKCLACNDEIPANTHKKLIRCACESIWVDGDGGYVRIGGNKENYEQIQK